MGRKLALAALVLVWTPVLPGQTPTVISPQRAAQQVGNSNNALPFAYGPSTYQQVHSAESFTNTAPRTITMLRTRPRFGQTTNTWVDLRLRMADCPNVHTQAASAFSANESPGTAVAVFNRQVVNLPPVTTVGWTVSLPFNQPFQWAGGHLSWFCEVYANSNGGQVLDRGFDAFADIGSVQPTAFSGCSSAFGTAPPDLFVHLHSPGQDVVLEADSYVPAGGLLAAFLFGGVPMNVDLTQIGAPGCFVTNDILGVLYAITAPGPYGAATIRTPVPSNPVLAGVAFRTQSMFLQIGANRLGLFFTNGTTNTIGEDPGITRIFGAGGSATGTVEPRYGLAIGLN